MANNGDIASRQRMYIRVPYPGTEVTVPRYVVCTAYVKNDQCTEKEKGAHTSGTTMKTTMIKVRMKLT